jgi:hypothetical protein
MVKAEQNGSVLPERLPECKHLCPRRDLWGKFCAICGAALTDDDEDASMWRALLRLSEP